MIHSNKAHKFPVILSSLACLFMTTYSLLYPAIWSTIFLTVSNYVSLSISFCLNFKPRNPMYSRMKTYMNRITFCTMLTVIGIGTSQMCTSQAWIWIKFILGWVITNITIPYVLYTQAQITLFIRGINLQRGVNMTGTVKSPICVTYFYD